MRNRNELAKGYECPVCRRYNLFSMWVYAHWDELLRTPCSGCKSVMEVQKGKVVSYHVNEKKVARRKERT